jgi:hypothetical protein
MYKPEENPYDHERHPTASAGIRDDKTVVYGPDYIRPPNSMIQFQPWLRE